MTKPHKHAALIKAWADGAEIQARNFNSNLWFDIPNATSGITIDWGLHYDYRIKKAPVVRWQWIIGHDVRRPFLTEVFFTEAEVKELFSSGDEKIIGKAEWTRTEFDE